MKKWAFIVTLTLGVIWFLLYVSSRIRHDEALQQAARASSQRRLEHEEYERKLAEKKSLEDRNQAWERCMRDGNRPVIGGLTTVVCIKREAIAWVHVIR